MTAEEVFAAHWPSVKEAYAEWNKHWDRYVGACHNKWSWTHNDFLEKQRAERKLTKLLFSAASNAYNLPRHRSHHETEVPK